MAACTTTKALNIQVVEKSDSRGILEALVRLGCEATWPKFLYCDADSAILKIMKEMEVDIRDLQYRLHTEHGAVFEVCPVGGHERQGLVERRIATVQSSFKEMAALLTLLLFFLLKQYSIQALRHQHCWPLASLCQQ